MNLKRSNTPEGVYYRRGATAIAGGALLMAAGVASGYHGTGAPVPGHVAAAAVAWSLLAVLAAVAAIFLNAYTRSAPAILKMLYRRQGSLAGWEGFRAAADAQASAKAGTGLARLLVGIRKGTWTTGR